MEPCLCIASQRGFWELAFALNVISFERLSRSHRFTYAPLRSIRNFHLFALLHLHKYSAHKPSGPCVPLGLVQDGSREFINEKGRVGWKSEE